MQGKNPPVHKARVGRPSSNRAPSKKVLLRLYAAEGRSIREIGETLNCSKDMVARAVKAYGIEARTKVQRSSLTKLNREALESNVWAKGVRGTAKKPRGTTVLPRQESDSRAQ